MATYRIRFQMVDTFEIVTDLCDTAKEAKDYVRKEIEDGNTFAENREFISWDTGTVQVIEKLN